MKKISLTEVVVSESARKRVEEVLLSGRIGQGPLIQEFEERFAEWVGSKYAVAVSSGTMADTIALAVLKHMEPEKKEVLIPALTFAAQLNSVLYNGLVPVFFDVEKDWFGQPFHHLIKETTLCAFPVNLLGYPSRCHSSDGVTVIEDSCESMGSAFMHKKSGTFGIMGTFSFFPSHTMTTGEGGMIVTDNAYCAELARRIRNHGKNSGLDFHFDVIGFNGKMTSIQAALGIEALKTVDEVIQKRRYNWLYLGGKEQPGSYISPHAFPVFLESREERDSMLKKLNDNGIECRNLFSCIPTQEKAYSFLGHKLGEFPVAESIGDCGLYVPCHQYLVKEELDRIKEIVHAGKMFGKKETAKAEAVGVLS